ncbi:NYN domain-containing protein [candidate division KSB1 bacterium]|nr:NYN domain-containing protein [candidate division KSB1 bacterium]
MLPKIIIDGYNVLHLIDSYQHVLHLDLERAREMLIHDVRVYRSYKSVDIMIVFDGAADVPTPFHLQRRGRIRIMFSKAPLKADPVIVKLVETDRRKRRITVVTADREVIQQAKAHGCTILHPQEFYSRIQAPHKGNQLNTKYEQDMSDDELDEWKRLFGIDE